MPKKSVMSFLNTKSWHPSTTRNIKKVWMAEQKAQEDAKREKERTYEIERERQQAEAARAHMTPEEARKAQLRQPVSFMYDPPPGFLLMQEKEKKDAEAKAAREKAAKEREANGGADAKPGDKAEEREERFPWLKNAPTEGAYTRGLDIHLKPLGKVIRNVRCIRCGQWGHKSGDKECPMFNKSTVDAQRIAREDPMSMMRPHTLPNYVLKHHGAMSPIRGGYRTEDENQQLVSEEPIEAEVEDEEERFLNSLTEDERRLVLEELQRQEQELKTTSSASASSSSSSSRKHSSKRSRSESPSSSPSRSRSREKHRKHHKHSDKKRRKSSPSPSRSHSRVGRKEKD